VEVSCVRHTGQHDSTLDRDAAPCMCGALRNESVSDACGSLPPRPRRHGMHALWGLGHSETALAIAVLPIGCSNVRHEGGAQTDAPGFASHGAPASCKTVPTQARCAGSSTKRKSRMARAC
jgi:hypothetical protein